MLRAGSIGAPINLPILGINMGHFGFLTEIQRDEWRQMLPRLLRGAYRLEERMLLHAEHIREDRVLSQWHVINEVVVCRGQFVRPIQVEARVDDTLLTTYVADGVIASTPTGSTAYALGAGGPILPPELRNILLIPVAPHLSMDRAIILAEGSSVTMTIHTSHEQSSALMDAHRCPCWMATRSGRRRTITPFILSGSRTLDTFTGILRIIWNKARLQEVEHDARSRSDENSLLYSSRPGNHAALQPL